MFVFRDLENLDEASIKTIITKVDRKVLGGRAQGRERIFENEVSENAIATRRGNDEGRY